jgi:alpha-tubulin suppressor-like RCC1 family protein
MCWGDNGSGQLGDGTRDGRPCGDEHEPGTCRFDPTPAIAAGTGAVEIAAGDIHSCARFDDGRAGCWGGNYAGQLADGTTEPRLSPSLLPTAISRIAAGFNHSCSLDTAGAVSCWGSNQFAKVGVDTSDNCTGIPCRRLPVLIDGPSDVVEVSLGDHQTCALQRDGAAFCWGLNEFGAVGNGGAANITSPDCGSLKCNSPTRIAEIGSVSSIASGGDHVCAATEDGEAYCWGDNVYGQLGVGHPDASEPFEETPKRVTLPEAVESVVAGHRFSCALTVGGAIWCWGLNSAGQLGDGTGAGDSCSLGERCRFDPVQVSMDLP